MLRYRNYWIYSTGLAIAWAVVLLLALMIRGREGAQPILLVFFGFVIGWVSTTIARYVYPPPQRWVGQSTDHEREG
jgi:xanthine/uracil permease